MSIDELLNSYDPIDLQYEARFHDPDEEYPGIEDRGEYVITGRDMDSNFLSFIPSREEVERILLLEPLRTLLIGQ